MQRSCKSMELCKKNLVDAIEAVGCLTMVEWKRQIVKFAFFDNLQLQLDQLNFSYIAPSFYYCIACVTRLWLGFTINFWYRLWKITTWWETNGMDFRNRRTSSPTKTFYTPVLKHFHCCLLCNFSLSRTLIETQTQVLHTVLVIKKKTRSACRLKIGFGFFFSSIVASLKKMFNLKCSRTKWIFIC